MLNIVIYLLNRHNIYHNFVEYCYLFVKQTEYRFDENPTTRFISLTVLRGIEADGITQIGDVNSIATVSYVLIANSAQAGVDYRGQNGQSSGQLVFPVGVTSASIYVEVFDDSEPEVEESFQV